MEGRTDGIGQIREMYLPLKNDNSNINQLTIVIIWRVKGKIGYNFETQDLLHIEILGNHQKKSWLNLILLISTYPGDFVWGLLD